MVKRFVLAAVLVILYSGAVFAVPENIINYQGYLKENGTAVGMDAAVTKQMTFSLYDADTGGSQLCTSGTQNVTVTKGLFSYKVGSSVGCDLSTIDWSDPVYLEIEIDGNTFSTRELIAPSAFSISNDASSVTFTPAGDIAATDAQSAIEELDTEKLSLSGGTVTGALTLMSDISLLGDFTGATSTVTAQSVSVSNFLAASGSIYASGTFYGDGSGLTNLSIDSKVARSGDSMYGDLSLATSTVSAMGFRATSFIGASGPIYASGAIAATTFYGDGSNLSGLVASATDADSLDGIDSSGFVRRNGSTMGGNLTAATSTISALIIKGDNVQAIDGLFASGTFTGNITTGDDLIDMATSGSRVFYVDNGANVYASGTFYGNGSHRHGHFRQPRLLRRQLRQRLRQRHFLRRRLRPE